ncbi:MAG: methyltransferase domain-containing protein [Pseudomonadota bacterium]|nr:methyltransferase domain-containing protein [Pseudomonadota bacterium]
MTVKTYERHVSSGDLIADRRYEFARDLAARGDLGGARDLLAQALELAPHFAAAWFALGEIKSKAGDKDGAIAAFRAVCEADPQDRHGAGLQLALLGAGDGAMPAGYVRVLFDQYAPDFDRALGEGLGYRAPALLLAAIAAACKDGRREMRFGAMLDLGCGTGLAGAAFRPHVDWLTGVDLSSGMIAQARAKGFYDRLIVGDIMQFLAAEAAARAQHHLVVAADVFAYFSDLAPIAAAVARVLAPGGFFAFTTETDTETDDGAAANLRATLRYAHSAAHVRAAVEGAGLQLLALTAQSTRTEKGIAVPGLLAVARRG